MRNVDQGYKFFFFFSFSKFGIQYPASPCQASLIPILCVRESKNIPDDKYI